MFQDENLDVNKRATATEPTLRPQAQTRWPVIRPACVYGFSLRALQISGSLSWLTDRLHFLLLDDGTLSSTALSPVLIDYTTF